MVATLHFFKKRLSHLRQSRRGNAKKRQRSTKNLRQSQTKNFKLESNDYSTEDADKWNYDSVGIDYGFEIEYNNTAVESSSHNSETYDNMSEITLEEEEEEDDDKQEARSSVVVLGEDHHAHCDGGLALECTSWKLALARTNS